MDTKTMNLKTRSIEIVDDLNTRFHDKPWKVLQAYLESRNGTPLYEGYNNTLFETIVASGEFHATLWHGELKWAFLAPSLSEILNNDSVERFNLSTEYPLDSGVSLQATYSLEAAWFINPNQVILENLKKVLGETFMERLVADIVSG